MQSYDQAIRYYQKAEKELNENFHFKVKEEADLYYSISLTANKQNKVELCLVYGKMALEIYQKSYNYKRCVECLLLLGISFKGIKLYDKSMDCLMTATTISKTISNKNLLSLCNQNIGELYSAMDQSIDSISYFKKTLELRKDCPVQKRIIPISSLVKEYIKINDIPNAKKWIQEGLILTEFLDDSFLIYIYEFQVYHLLVEGKEDLLENLVIKKLLPLLKEKGLFFEHAFYLKQLAEYYYKKRKYKLSAHYYQAAMNSIHNVIYRR